MFADSQIKQANMISRPEKQPEMKIQTEEFQQIDVGTNTTKNKTKDTQTVWSPYELKKDLDCNINKLLPTLKLSQQLIQQSQIERNLVTALIKEEKRQQLQETKSLNLNMRSFLQYSYNPQDLFYFYSQNKLHFYFKNGETSQYFQTYFSPAHQIAKICESQLVYATPVKNVTAYCQAPGNANAFVFATQDGYIGYNLLSLMQKNDFQPPYSTFEKLHAGAVVFVEIIKFQHLKQFTVLSVSALGRILVHEFTEDKFELKGGCCLKKQKAAMQVGRSVTSAGVASAAGNTVSVFVATEDGQVQIVQLFSSRANLPQITNFAQLADGNQYKVLRTNQVKPGKVMILPLNQQLIENQQSFAKLLLNQCALTLDGQGQLQLLVGNRSAVRYFAEQPIVAFAHFDRFVVGLTETQVLLYQLFEQKPVQLNCGEYKLQNVFNNIQVVQYNSQLAALLVVDELKVDFQILQMLLPFSLVTLNEFGKALYNGLQINE